MPHEYLERYERWMNSAGRTERTITQRLRRASHILSRWPDPGAVTPSDVTEWLGQANHLSRWTRATYYSDTKAFFRWLFIVELIPLDPTDTELMERPRTRSGIPKPLSAIEEIRVLDSAHGNMRAFLLLALRAGLRASEIAAFRGENITDEAITLTGKGEKEAQIPTHPELWALAQQFPRRGWWFPSPQHAGHIAGGSVTIMVGKHFRACDIPTGSIHRCRHSYATALLRRGANMRQVQTLMRHSSPATTAIYTAVDEDELRAAINLLGPVA